MLRRGSRIYWHLPVHSARSPVRHHYELFSVAARWLRRHIQIDGICRPEVNFLRRWARHAIPLDRRRFLEARFGQLILISCSPNTESEALFRSIPEMYAICGRNGVSVGLRREKGFRTINVQRIRQWGLFSPYGTS